MDQRRSLRMASVIRTIIARFIMNIPPNIAKGVSITEIKVSQDLLYADVYISAIEGLEAALKQLRSRLRDIRKELAKTMTTYTVPAVRFKEDHRGEELSELDHLIASL
jgi:ribosome-binding factor A